MTNRAAGWVFAARSIGDSSVLVLYLGVVPGVADGEGAVVGEDLEEAAGDGDGLLLGHVGVDPPHVHRPLPGEVPPKHLPRGPSEPAATPAAAASVAALLAGVESVGWAGSGCCCNCKRK